MKKSVVLILMLCVAVGAFASGGKESAAPASTGPVTLKFWTFLNPADTAPRSVAQNTIIENFKKQNPNISVDVQVLSWADISPRIIQAVAAGNPPDVTRVASDSLDTQFAAKTLQSLDEFVNKLPDPAAFRNDWALPYDLGKDKGVKRSLWIDNRAVMIYYNKKHLAEVGATEPPKTWDEMGTLGGKLAQKGYIGFAVGLGTGGAGNGLMEWFKPMLWLSGGDLVDANGKAAFNSPAGEKAMQFLSDLVYKYKATPMEIITGDVDAMFQGFQSKRVSMLSFANHRFVTAQATLGADAVGWAPMPSFDGKAPAPGHVTGWMLAIPNGVKNPEASWKFINYHTGTEANIINAKVGGELPARKSAFQDPYFQNDPVGKEMVKWQGYILNNGRMPQFPADYLFLHQVICEAAQQIIQNKQPIKASLDAAATKYNSKK